MFSPHARSTAVALMLAAGAFCAAPAAAKKPRAAQSKPAQQIFCGPQFAQMNAAELLASLSERTGGGHLAILGDRSYVRYPDGSLARIVPCGSSR